MASRVGVFGIAAASIALSCGGEPVQPGDAPASFSVVAGDNQIQFPGLELNSRLAVSVLDANGTGVAGVPVGWMIVQGNGLVEVSVETTDNAGTARASLILGDEPGSIMVEASLDGFAPVRFTARAVEPGPIVFVSNRRAGFPGDQVAGFPGDLHVMNVDGSDVVPLLPSSRPVDFIADPTWSPVRDQILFARSEPRPAGGTPGAVPLGLYVTPANGSTDQQLPPSGTPPIVEFLQEPSWSPNGDSVVARHAQDSVLYVLRKTATDVVRLTSRGGLSPSWSPVGGSVAFACLSGPSTHICVVNTDGNGNRQITDGQVVDGEPAWSPDGTQILFSRDSSTAGGLWLINADGTGLTQMLVGTVTSPAWSPDGLEFLATRHEANGSDIVRVNVASGAIVNLTNSPGVLDRQPSWKGN